jgi:hypothetical protein
MPDYTLFKINDHHEVQPPALYLAHETKVSAMTMAAELASECYAVEVWLGTKMVGRIGRPIAVSGG